MSARNITAIALLGVLCAGFTALGIWQIERRAWKHALIERVTSRVKAPAADAPPSSDWPQVSAARDEYRHVRLTGTWLVDRSARVQAVTERGSGFWLMTPLRQVDGSSVFVNRGLVEQATTDSCATAGTIEVTGLLRMSEPGGGFLRHNDAAADHWYSRDVAAMAAARGLANVAPYFVDAAAQPVETSGCPIGGLTVIAFHDSHTVYALTWFALALMSVAGAWQVLRTARPRGMVHDTAMKATPPDIRAG